nr:putative ribonuclease H-like domain-containing protein [Tanacetum cinerariifolium]
MKLFFQSKGIVHQTTCPHTPEQNGVAERKNRFLLEMTRSLIIESRVPKSFWPEALATATYLINRLRTKILKMKTPLETLSGYTTISQPLTLQPKVFGCTVFAHIPKSYRDKLDPCAEKCVFVGYEWSGGGTSTTSAEAPNISVTPEHPVPDMISEVSSSQPNNFDNPQPDNLDENNRDDIQDSTSEILQEHEDEVPRKYVLPPRSNRGVPPKRYSPEKTTRGAKYPMANIVEGNLSNN